MKLPPKELDPTRDGYASAPSERSESSWRLSVFFFFLVLKTCSEPVKHSTSLAVVVFSLLSFVPQLKLLLLPACSETSKRNEIEIRN